MLTCWCNTSICIKCKLWLKSIESGEHEVKHVTLCWNDATIIFCEQYSVSSHWFLHTEMELRCAVSFVLCSTVYNKSTWTTAWTCLQRSDNFKFEGQSFVPPRYVAMETINEIDNRHLVYQLNKSSSLLWFIRLKQNQNVDEIHQNVIIVGIVTSAKVWQRCFCIKI